MSNALKINKLIEWQKEKKNAPKLDYHILTEKNPRTKKQNISKENVGQEQCETQKSIR